MRAFGTLALVAALAQLSDAQKSMFFFHVNTV
jgi:hypothetical protein